MRESNSLVGNAANIFLKRKVLLNTKGQYMTESNTLVVNATNSFPRGVFLQDTIGLYIKANRY